jgi:hypothetical protein
MLRELWNTAASHVLSAQLKEKKHKTIKIRALTYFSSLDLNPAKCRCYQQLLPFQLLSEATSSFNKGLCGKSPNPNKGAL